MKCPLCASPNGDLLYASTMSEQALLAGDFKCTSSAYGEHGDIRRCRECGLVYLDDIESHNALGSLIERVEDPDYEIGELGRVATFVRLVRAIEKRARLGHLIEIGTYTGTFLEIARDRGWSVEGLEPSHWAVECAAAKDLSVHQGLLAEDSFPHESADVVAMWDVIEHLSDPMGAVKSAFAFLKPDGLIALSTMDAGSPAALVSRSRWPWLMNMHRVYFSRKTMRRMLHQSGFTDIRFRNHIRFIRVSYLAERMALRLAFLGKALAAFGKATGTSDALVPFSIGDLFEVYARKPS